MRAGVSSRKDDHIPDQDYCMTKVSGLVCCSVEVAKIPYQQNPICKQGVVLSKAAL